MWIWLAAIESPEDSLRFEAIYRNYRDLMYYTARKILGNDKDAEDVVHDAFVAVIDCLDKLPAQVGPKTRAFVVAVTESRAIDLYRRRKKLACVEYDDALAVPDFACPIDQLAEGNAVSRAIAALPAEYRDVLLLRFDVGLPVRRLAVLLGKKEDTVYKLIDRARTRLAKELEKEGAAL